VVICPLTASHDLQLSVSAIMDGREMRGVHMPITCHFRDGKVLLFRFRKWPDRDVDRRRGAIVEGPLASYVKMPSVAMRVVHETVFIVCVAQRW